MRKALDALYGVSLIGACLSMVLIATLVSLQVLGRVADRLAVLLGGARYGFAIPSLAEIGGFLFVSSAFLALPAALRSAGHVRVTLALRLFGDRGDRVMSIFVLAIGLCLAAFAAWAIGVQTLASFERGSVSYGLVPIALWIPQAVMTLGLAVFVIALLDELVTALSGHEPAFRQVEKQRETGEGAH